ncbi:vicilin Jug r 6.0101-like [Rosa rugosa]|uniref:vicilin Jug r 6.0101-like n=1 Tax=Rosa rugosa TaxID=74645 RepID=UPI002B40884C|nr:vicilin Jug r 6.0101-like [Rosa rugosa]
METIMVITQTPIMTRKSDTRHHAWPQPSSYLPPCLLYIAFPRSSSSSRTENMELKSKLCLVVLLFSVLLAVSASQDYKERDPELKQCKHQCKHQRGYDEQEKQLCEQRCDDYIKQKRQDEKQRRREGEGGTSFYRYDEDQYQGQGQQQQDQNPYLFEDQDFETQIETDQGRVQILQKFTDKSDLLRGIENFRIGSLVTKPHSFVAPHHHDADCVLFVFQGRPTITMVRGEKRESHNLERGDILRVPAGTPVYIINRDDNEKLFVVKLLHPVSLPDQFETFYEGGGENPESFFKAFSPEVLQAAFKTERDELERLFGQQRQGSIMKASREQIEKMSHSTRGREGFWPFHGDEPFSTSSSKSGPFNLFKKRPSQSNRHGRLFEADSNDYKQLEELDLQITFANITRGSMTAPSFNSKATKIAFVLDGEGFFEMACPHLASQGGSQHQQQRQRRSSSPSYQNVRGDLRRGTVFIVPAGHPVTAIASSNNNLQVICFEVNAKDNVRFPLAGKKNVVSLFEREAKELAFGVPVREVDRIFNKQDGEFFLEGPNNQQQGRMWSVV